MNNSFSKILSIIAFGICATLVLGPVYASDKDEAVLLVKKAAEMVKSAARTRP